MSSASATKIAMNTIPSSETTIKSSEIQTQNSTPKFDLKTLRDAFMNCIQPDNTLLLREYVRAYEELCV
jgi:hypothetical protein